MGILLACLDEFSNTAGLRANTMKSNIFLVGVSDAVKNELLQMTGFQLGSFPFRYLGIPVASTRLTISDFCLCLTNFPAKLKLDLVTLSPMRVDWNLYDRYCRPIESGGRGLRDLKTWNKSLLCKVLWNIHQKDTLWIKWVNHFILQIPGGSPQKKRVHR